MIHEVMLDGVMIFETRAPTVKVGRNRKRVAFSKTYT